MTNINLPSARPLDAAWILGIALVCLITGHFALKTFFPSLAVNLLAMLFIGLILFYVLHIRRDIFGFVLIIYISSHFIYAANQGGLFNLLAFVLLFLYVLRFRFHETIRQDRVVKTLLWVLIISNILGWIFVTPAPAAKVILGATSFFGYLLMFYVTSNISISKTRLRHLLIVIGAMISYNFLVSLNHTYSVVKVVTPLLGLDANTLYATTNAFGVFSNGAMNGEYSMMMFALLIPLLQPKVLRNELGLRPALYVFFALLSAGTVVLSNTRGSAILTALIIVLYGVLFSVMYRNVRGVLKNLNIILATGLLVILGAGAFLGVMDLAQDLREVGDLTVERVVSGEALNRFGIWQLGWDRLTQNNWLIGYGHGVPEINWIAQAGGEFTGETHLHSLYLSLPLLYGWVGAIAYLMLFLVTAARLFQVVRRYDARHYLVALCLGLLIAWFGFLAEELKSGVMIQEPHYPMIMWILLGLSNAAVKTIRVEVLSARRSDRVTAIAAQPVHN